MYETMCNHFKSDTVASIKTLFRVPCFYTGWTDRQTDTHTQTHIDSMNDFKLGTRKRQITDFNFIAQWLKNEYQRSLRLSYNDMNSPKRIPTIMKWRNFFFTDLLLHQNCILRKGQSHHCRSSRRVRAHDPQRWTL